MTPCTKWSVTGALIGACFALLTQAPATWLAHAISEASQHRFVLRHAQGTVWQGSAIAVLSDGHPPSNSPNPRASSGTALPSRLHWNFSSGFDSRLMRFVMHAQLQSACCTPEPLQWVISLGWQGLRIEAANQQSQWPAIWLVGLGAPWNTVQAEGSMQLRTENLMWQSHAGAPKVEGVAELTLSQLATPLSTLRPLGTYRIRVQGGDTMVLSLATLEGGLLLSGHGEWANGRLQFKGEARAQPALEAALSNLLNILGQRQGTISILQLG